MKRFILSGFLLFAGLSVFAQSYDDWNKLFTEYKGDSVKDTYKVLEMYLPYDKDKEEMNFIFSLLIIKNEQGNNASIEDKMYYNQCFTSAENQYPKIQENAAIFISFLNQNKLNIYNISDLNRYDLSKEYKQVSVRELQLLPSRFKNQKICFEARYENTDMGYANFVYYDSVDSQFKNIGVKYTDEAAELLLNIKKERFNSNNYYNLYGTVEGSFFVIEYLEHI